MLPADSTTSVLEVLQAETTTVQNIHNDDVIIASVAASARRLEDDGQNNEQRADTHFTAQGQSEDAMNTANLKASTASNDEEFSAGSTAYDRNEVLAQDHNTAGHSALSEATANDAQADALKHISEIRQAVVEEENRTTFAKTEIEERTREDVNQDMVREGATQPAEDLEAQLKLLAQAPSAAAPGA